MTQQAVKVVELENLLSNIRDAQTVVRTADETFSERNEIFAGIFEMLEHKLTMIENNAKDLLRVG